MLRLSQGRGRWAVSQKPKLILNFGYAMHMAPVVRKVDCAIHWISYYTVDSATGYRTTYRLDSDLSGGRG